MGGGSFGSKVEGCGARGVLKITQDMVKVVQCGISAHLNIWCTRQTDVSDYEASAYIRTQAH